MWSMTIDDFVYTALGYDGEKGIDMFLLNRAKDEGKEIQEVESMLFQLEMRGSLSPELQEILLADSVDAYQNSDNSEELDQLLQAWCEGDESTVTELLMAETDTVDEELMPLMEEFEKAMITDRNIGMADFAENALQEDEQVFICVGLAHIIGEGGMVDLLTQRGYTVEQVNG